MISIMSAKSGADGAERMGQGRRRRRQGPAQAPLLLLLVVVVVLLLSSLLLVLVVVVVVVVVVERMGQGPAQAGRVGGVSLLLYDYD